VEYARQAREGFESGELFQFPPPSERAQEITIPGPGGDIPLRVFRPKERQARGVMLHIHGGGWVVGRASMNDVTNEARADDLGLVIVSVDYRLAPEHPYPAGPDDCEAAALWVLSRGKAELGVDPERFLVGGESAGGHLAAVTVLRMRGRHGFLFRGANLVYGLYDMGGVPSHALFDDRNVILNSTSIGWFTDCFVPDADQRRDPDVSPLYADLAGLPPALFTIGTLDPLRDHTLFLYARWIAAGSPGEIQIFPGGPHGFDMFPVPEGLAAQKRIREFLDECLQ
jgi:acetyl esterase/lipase